MFVHRSSILSEGNSYFPILTGTNSSALLLQHRVTAPTRGRHQGRPSYQNVSDTTLVCNMDDESTRTLSHSRTWRERSGPPVTDDTSLVLPLETRVRVAGGDGPFVGSFYLNLSYSARLRSAPDTAGTLDPTLFSTQRRCPKCPRDHPEPRSGFLPWYSPVGVEAPSSRHFWILPLSRSTLGGLIVGGER